MEFAINVQPLRGCIEYSIVTYNSQGAINIKAFQRLLPDKAMYRYIFALAAGSFKYVVAGL
jgi:hypothetical protein